MLLMILEDNLWKLILSEPLATVIAVITQAANVLICSPSLYFVLVLYTTLGASWETTTFAHPDVSLPLQNVLTESIHRL